MEGNEGESGEGKTSDEEQGGRRKGVRFCQLGDLAHLDLIYKKALLVTRQYNNNNKNLFGGGTVGSSTIEQSKDQHGTRSGCVPSDLAAARVWKIGHHLMGLLATGMVSNLAKRRTESQASR